MSKLRSPHPELDLHRVVQAKLGLDRAFARQIEHVLMVDDLAAARHGVERHERRRQPRQSLHLRLRERRETMRVRGARSRDGSCAARACSQSARSVFSRIAIALPYMRETSSIFCASTSRRCSCSTMCGARLCAASEGCRPSRMWSGGAERTGIDPARSCKVGGEADVTLARGERAEQRLPHHFERIGEHRACTSSESPSRLEQTSNDPRAGHATSNDGSDASADLRSRGARRLRGQRNDEVSSPAAARAHGREEVFLRLSHVQHAASDEARAQRAEAPLV